MTPQKFSALFEMFAIGEYAECHRLLHEQEATTYFEAFLGLICLQRLEQHTLVARVASDLRAYISPSAFESRLLGLILGEEDIGSVFALATTDHDVCQVHFYAGMWLQANLMNDLAPRAFQRCVATEVPCLERAFAERLLAAMSDDSDDEDTFARIGQLQKDVFAALNSGAHEQAIAIGRAALEYAIQKSGEDSGEAGLAHHLLGQLFHQLKEWPQTAEHCEAGFRLLEPRAGAEHPLTLDCLHGLAVSMHNLGQTAEAEQRYLQVIERRTKALGPDDHRTLESVDSLAYLYETQEDFPAARRWLQVLLDTRLQSLGEDNDHTLATVDSMATLLEKMGELQAAQPLRQLAVDGRRRTHGPWHSFTLDSEADLLALLLRSGLRTDAATVVQRVVDEAATCPTSKKESVAAGLESLAKLCNKAGEYGLLVSVRRAEWTTAQVAFGSGDSRLVTITSSLAYTLHMNGELAEAEQLSKEVLEQQRRTHGNDHPDVAFACNNLAQVYQSWGRFADAIPLMTEALRIDQQALGERHTDVAGDHNNLGIALLNMGQLAQAKQHLQEAVDIWKVTYPVGHDRTVAALQNLASVYTALRDAPTSEALFREALEMTTRLHGADHPQTIRLATTLADLEANTGRAENGIARVRAAHQSVAARLGDKHPLTATAALTLARALLDSDETRTEGEQLLAQTLATIELDPSAEQTTVREGLLFLGKSQAARGDYTTAEATFQKALDVSERCGAKTSTHTEVLRCLGLTRFELGDWKAALELLCEVATAEDRFFREAAIISSSKQRVNFLDVARDTHRQILWLVAQHLADDPTAVRRSFDFVLRRKALAFVLDEQHYHWRHQADADSSALLRELDQLRDQLADIYFVAPNAPSSLKAVQAVKAWEAECRQIEEQLAERCASAAVFDAPATRQALAAQLPKGAALVELVVTESYGSHEWKSLPSPRQRMGRETAILAYILRQDEPENVRLVVLSEANAVYEAVVQFLIGVTGDLSWSRYLQFKAGPDGTIVNRSPTVPQWRDAGRELAALVIDPLLPALAGCEQLLIAPDGVLTHVPFDILPLADGKLLCDLFHITFLGAGRDLLRLATPAPAATPPVVFAAPDFDLTDPQRELSLETIEALGFALSGQRGLDLMATYSLLDGAAEEGQVVGEILGVTPLLGAAATRQAVRGLKSPRLLHLATHGYAPDGMMTSTDFLPMLASIDIGLMGQLPDPLYLSGLALAGINWKSNYFRSLAQKAEAAPENKAEHMENAAPQRVCVPPLACGDGRLTAADVLRLDLRGTELVTLSACVTALGVLRPGDGVQGLLRSFTIAGSRAVVSSLWSVPDQQTTAIMREFYRGLVSGQGRGEALRNARAKLRRRYPEQPKYWAAFVLYGAWTPLPNTTEE